eukprot:6294433-Prymnesium_polylepis.1
MPTLLRTLIDSSIASSCCSMSDMKPSQSGCGPPCSSLLSARPSTDDGLSSGTSPHGVVSTSRMPRPLAVCCALPEPCNSPASARPSSPAERGRKLEPPHGATATAAGRVPTSTMSAARQPSTMPLDGTRVVAFWTSRIIGPSQMKQCATFGARAIVMNHMRRFCAPSPIQHLERRTKTNQRSSGGFFFSASSVERQRATPPPACFRSRWCIRQSRSVRASPLDFTL